ncbi:MAG: flavodoxin domain-containing protein [Methanocorpusculum sp.]|nr:flavodoxin domain-containing protein [Methanocorpusculum sp.]
MKAVVVYRSKYGSAKRYAEWIAEDLGADIFDAEVFHPEDFAKYDVVVYGGSVYAGAVLGIALVSENMAVLRNKRTAVFTVGLTSPDAAEVLENLRAKNFSDEMLKKVRAFHFPGAVEYAKLSLKDKLIMKMINSSMREKIDLHQDNVSRAAIAPLVSFALGGEADE